MGPAALGRRAPNGSSQLFPTGRSVSTDDRGQYRVFDLRPGDYYVLAKLWSQRSGSSASGEPRIGHIPTYYPGAAALDGARLVTVRSGQETSGIDFGLLQGNLARITAKVLDSAGNALTREAGGLSLAARGVDGIARGGFSSRTTADGSFVLENVSPGDYALSAFVRGDGASGPSEGAWLPLTVNGEDLNIDIRTNKGATLSGRVIVEGRLPEHGAAGTAATLSTPVSLRPEVRVMAMPSSGISTQGSTPGRSDPVGDDGTFRITGVRGSARLRVWGARAALKSIRRGSEDLMSQALDLTGTESIDQIEIVLTTETGNLAGMVTDSAGAPAPATWLLVFTEDRRLWFPDSPFVRPSQSLTAEAVAAAAARLAAARQAGGVSLRPVEAAAIPRAAGQYMVSGLLPGRYYVVALEGESGNGLTRSQFDAEHLSSLREKATAVTVAAGETTTANVRVGR